MIEGESPLMQALLGTLVTWGATAAGAAIVFFVPKSMHPKVRSLSVPQGLIRGFDNAAGSHTFSIFALLL